MTGSFLHVNCCSLQTWKDWDQQDCDLDLKLPQNTRSKVNPGLSQKRSPLIQVGTPLPAPSHPFRTMAVFNVFRVLGDIAHLASVCVLVWAIHRNKSAEGKGDGPFMIPSDNIIR